MFANSLGIKPKPVLGFGNAVLAAIVIGKPDVSDCKITLPAAERIGVVNTPGSAFAPSYPIWILSAVKVMPAAVLIVLLV